MTYHDVEALATVCCAFLLIWELMQSRWRACVLSLLAMGCIALIPKLVGSVFAIVLVLPVVFEERWNVRSEKDLVRGILAAGVIAPCVLLIATAAR